MIAKCIDCTYYKPDGSHNMCDECDVSSHTKFHPKRGGNILIEAVDSPNHYKLFRGDKEVVDLIRDRLDGYSVSTTCMDAAPEVRLRTAAWYKDVIKYTMRWYSKDGLQDLRKAKKYIEYMIEELS